MNLSHGSSGTTALTNALKQVFYIHKDVVAELKIKLDTLAHENERLKKELHKVSPRRSDKCESCAHLRELNTTLQENFNSRLKDKNAIIKHLERRLRATGAGDDGSCTSYTEDVSARAEVSAPLIDDTSGFCSQNANDSLESQADGHSGGGQSEAGDDLCLGRLQSKRLRLLRDGRKRSRYVEEAPESKRQKTSPTLKSPSHGANPAASLASPETDKSAAFETHSPVKESPKSTAKKKLIETILAPETENTLHVQVNDSVIQAINEKSGRNEDFSGGDEGRNTRLKNLVIPETLGLDVQSDDTDSDSDNDAVSSVLHSSSQPDENVDTETNDVIAGDLEVTACPDIKHVSSEIKTPNVSASKTEITPSSLSPGIFDEVRKVRSNSDTPKLARPVIDGEIISNGASSKSQRSPRNRSEKNVSLPPLTTASNQRLLRQATLSQSFKRNHSPGTKQRSGHSSKISEENDDEVELHKAIKASLEESLAGQKNKSVERFSFKVPMSPVKSPHQKNVNEKENDVTSGCRTSPRSAKPAQETRRSPRLSKLVKTHSDPRTSKQMESARKNLFAEGSSPHKKTTQEISKGKSVEHTSEREKQKLATFSDHSKNCAHVSVNCLNEAVSDHESQKSRRDRKKAVSDKTEGKEQTQSSHLTQRNTSDQTCELNGSLNPDVQLSMYLQSQKMSIGSEVHPMTELDETVAPNLLSESKIWITSSQAMRELGCLDTEEVTQYDKVTVDSTLMEDSSDSEETIAPSPEPNSLVSLHSQSQSMPCASIPSSSRSFKFMSKLRGKSLTDPSGTDSRKPHGKTLVGSQSCDGFEIPKACEEKNKNRLGSPQKMTAGASRVQTSFKGDSHPKQKVTINDSFDVVPKPPEEFPHIKVVRKQSEKDKLQGFSCKECYEYYKDLNLSEAELKYRMQVCSRHKAKYQPPATPEHFWSLSIPDTAEVDDPADGHMDQAGVYKGPRRRRRLEKRFKSKHEEEI